MPVYSLSELKGAFRVGSTAVKELAAAVSEYAGPATIRGIKRGAMIGAGLGAAHAGYSDARNGNIGMGTPVHMLWGGLTGGFKGASLGYAYSGFKNMGGWSGVKRGLISAWGAEPKVSARVASVRASRASRGGFPRNFHGLSAPGGLGWQRRIGSQPRILRFRSTS